MSDVTGIYFDGRESHARHVIVAFTADQVIVRGDGVDWTEPADLVTVSEAVGTSPRYVRFQDGAFCEVSKVDGLARALAPVRPERGRLHRWERDWRLVAAIVVGLVVAMVVGYRDVLPAAIDLVATRLPRSALDLLSRQALDALDGDILQPTALTPARTREIQTAFQRFAGAEGNDIRLQFRRSDAIGPNALALPSGDVVVTDALEKLATNDEELMAVLAHEVGHVRERHALRNLLQASAISALLAWYIGDVSALAAAAPTMLLNARYSRDFERSADAYAAKLLRARGIAPGRLADILDRLERTRKGGLFEQGPALGYLSTHPATAERVKGLREGAPETK